MESRISLKEYFGSEATGFTPWLQNHDVVIKDILDDENVEFYKREAKVDDFYIDLMYRKNKDVYIIENQYGISNHDHLGKCILYSTLVKAKKTVWITESICEEHLKIYKELNINLYLCSITLEKVEGKLVRMKVFVYSKNNSMKQFIYLLNIEKAIVKKMHK